jgi:hypothetical protein
MSVHWAAVGRNQKQIGWFFNAEAAEGSQRTRRNRANYPQMSPMGGDESTVIWDAAGLS